MIEGLDSAKCAQRNRIAALRYGIDAAPVRFIKDFNAAPEMAPVSQPNVIEGWLPETADEALAKINSMLPSGAVPLTADQIFVHFGEAANGSFISDRFMFMGESTLRNIAKGAAAGVAFQNSHATGGLSHPAELPFGRTFAGQYQEWPNENGSLLRRSLFAFYMLRGVKPTGENGPSTDDLDKMIRGGQVFDVSVGLSGGERLCDLCGNMVRSEDCTHAPGTHRNMTDDDRNRQKGRGIAKGSASYTLENAELGEISAVFDGAVPGAGITKVFALKDRLSAGDWQEALSAYEGLLDSFAPSTNGADFDLSNESVIRNLSESIAGVIARNLAHEISLLQDAVGTEAKSKKENTAMSNEVEDKESGLARFYNNLKAFFSSEGGEAVGSNNPAPKTANALPGNIVSAPSAEVERLTAETQTLKAERQQERLAQIKADAETFYQQQFAARTVLPAQKDRVVEDYIQAATDDLLHPLTASEGQTVTSRVDKLKARYAAMPKHNLTNETIGDAKLFALPDGEEGIEAGKMTPERRKAYLASTAAGRMKLQDETGKRPS